MSLSEIQRGKIQSDLNSNQMAIANEVINTLGTQRLDDFDLHARIGSTVDDLDRVLRVMFEQGILDRQPKGRLMLYWLK